METDIIRDTQCRYCKNLVGPGTDGKYRCKNRIPASFGIEETSLESSCINFEKKEVSILQEIYEETKKVLKDYIDTKEENYEIITLWIIGTWMHRNFPTYPYLFFNAMKGSGKTRILKLIKEMSWQGDMLASLSEAVLFRTTGTLCIDEFEGITGKDKNALRELLNTAYKKGGKVKRMRKKKTMEGEQQVVEEFDTFRPIVMANIRGMDEVVGDRCITLIFEKSANIHITRKIENFSDNENIAKIKQKFALMPNSCRLCMYDGSQNIYKEWNNYVNNIHIPTYTSTYSKLHLFEKIWETNIDGRNLELSFPLLLIADEIGILDYIIEIIKKIITEKKEDDIMQSRDVMLLDLVSRQTPFEPYKVKELTMMFRQGISYDSEEEHWLNPAWMGRALVRLNLITSKKRITDGMEVILNISKAKEKLQMFK